MQGVEVGGAKGQTRTADRTIFSRELYQLSYLSVGPLRLRWSRGAGAVGRSESARTVGDRGLEPLTSTV